MPLRAPYFETASSVYWEQLGENRQLGGRAGLMNFW